ncbi:hypothetical protein EV702DRAFT_1045661 [Suillus placidus]|uniref:Uncharacterized protein n=1 Tax=Suillus placidus TaxID=48579 RepID=A0A9P6ZUE1_9AGAM|nr:hypothetical protein EV702DRAFT_1045661 [Suillus placidus]
MIVPEKYISTEVKIVYPLWPPPGHSSRFSPHVWNFFRPTIKMVKTLSHDGAYPAGDQFCCHLIVQYFTCTMPDSAHVVPRAGGQGLNSGIQYTAGSVTMLPFKRLVDSQFNLDSGVEISPGRKTHLTPTFAEIL